jgi:hypothetical protein
MKSKSVTLGIAALGVVLLSFGLLGLAPMNYALFSGIVCFVLVGLLPLVVWRGEAAEVQKQ